ALVALAAEFAVPRGPSHEPAPYHYAPGQWQKLPKSFCEDGPACYLYACSSHLIDADGTEENILHEVIRLNNRRGVELFGEYHQIVFDPTYQKLTLNEACVHKAGGGTVQVRPTDLQLRDSNID